MINSGIITRGLGSNILITRGYGIMQKTPVFDPRFVFIPNARESFNDNRHSFKGEARGIIFTPNARDSKSGLIKADFTPSTRQTSTPNEKPNVANTVQDKTFTPDAKQSATPSKKASVNGSSKDTFTPTRSTIKRST